MKSSRCLLSARGSRLAAVGFRQTRQAATILPRTCALPSPASCWYECTPLAVQRRCFGAPSGRDKDDARTRESRSNSGSVNGNGNSKNQHANQLFDLTFGSLNSSNNNKNNSKSDSDGDGDGNNAPHSHVQVSSPAVAAAPQHSAESVRHTGPRSASSYRGRLEAGNINGSLMTLVHAPFAPRGNNFRIILDVLGVLAERQETILSLAEASSEQVSATQAEEEEERGGGGGGREGREGRRDGGSDRAAGSNWDGVGGGGEPHSTHSSIEQLPPLSPDPPVPATAAPTAVGQYSPSLESADTVPPRPFPSSVTATTAMEAPPTQTAAANVAMAEAAAAGLVATRLSAALRQQRDLRRLLSYQIQLAAEDAAAEEELHGPQTRAAAAASAAAVFDFFHRFEALVGVLERQAARAAELAACVTAETSAAEGRNKAREVEVEKKEQEEGPEGREGEGGAQSGSGSGDSHPTRRLPPLAVWEVPPAIQAEVYHALVRLAAICGDAELASEVVERLTELTQRQQRLQERQQQQQQEEEEEKENNVVYGEAGLFKGENLTPAATDATEAANGCSNRITEGKSTENEQNGEEAEEGELDIESLQEMVLAGTEGTPPLESGAAGSAPRDETSPHHTGTTSDHYDMTSSGSDSSTMNSTMTSAIPLVFYPVCKHDHLLLLESCGPQKRFPTALALLRRLLSLSVIIAAESRHAREGAEDEENEAAVAEGQRRGGNNISSNNSIGNASTLLSPASTHYPPPQLGELRLPPSVFVLSPAEVARAAAAVAAAARGSEDFVLLYETLLQAPRLHPCQQQLEAFLAATAQQRAGNIKGINNDNNDNIISLDHSQASQATTPSLSSPAHAQPLMHYVPPDSFVFYHSLVRALANCEEEELHIFSNTNTNTDDRRGGPAAAGRGRKSRHLNMSLERLAVSFYRHARDYQMLSIDGRNNNKSNNNHDFNSEHLSLLLSSSSSSSLYPVSPYDPSVIASSSALQAQAQAEEERIDTVVDFYASLIKCAAKAKNPTQAFSFYHEVLNLPLTSHASTDTFASAGNHNNATTNNNNNNSIISGAGSTELAHQAITRHLTPAFYANYLLSLSLNNYAADAATALSVLLEAKSPLNISAFHSVLQGVTSFREAQEILSTIERLSRPFPSSSINSNNNNGTLVGRNDVVHGHGGANGNGGGRNNNNNNNTHENETSEYFFLAPTPVTYTLALKALYRHNYHPLENNNLLSKTAARARGALSNRYTPTQVLLHVTDIHAKVEECVLAQYADELDRWGAEGEGERDNNNNNKERKTNNSNSNNSNDDDDHGGVYSELSPEEKAARRRGRIDDVLLRYFPEYVNMLTKLLLQVPYDYFTESESQAAERHDNNNNNNHNHNHNHNNEASAAAPSITMYTELSRVFRLCQRQINDFFRCSPQSPTRLPSSTLAGDSPQHKARGGGKGGNNSAAHVHDGSGFSGNFDYNNNNYISSTSSSDVINVGVLAPDMLVNIREKLLDNPSALGHFSLLVVPFSSLFAAYNYLLHNNFCYYNAKVFFDPQLCNGAAEREAALAVSGGGGWLDSDDVSDGGGDTGGEWESGDNNDNDRESEGKEDGNDSDNNNNKRKMNKKKNSKRKSANNDINNTAAGEYTRSVRSAQYRRQTLESIRRFLSRHGAHLHITSLEEELTRAAEYRRYGIHLESHFLQRTAVVNGGDLYFDLPPSSSSSFSSSSVSSSTLSSSSNNNGDGNNNDNSSNSSESALVTVNYAEESTPYDARNYHLNELHFLNNYQNWFARAAGLTVALARGPFASPFYHSSSTGSNNNNNNNSDFSSSFPSSISSEAAAVLGYYTPLTPAASASAANGGINNNNNNNNKENNDGTKIHASSFSLYADEDDYVLDNNNNNNNNKSEHKKSAAKTYVQVILISENFQHCGKYVVKLKRYLRHYNRYNYYRNNKKNNYNHNGGHYYHDNYNNNNNNSTTAMDTYTIGAVNSAEVRLRSLAKTFRRVHYYNPFVMPSWAPPSPHFSIAESVKNNQAGGSIHVNNSKFGNEAKTVTAPADLYILTQREAQEWYRAAVNAEEEEESENENENEGAPRGAGDMNNNNNDDDNDMSAEALENLLKDL